MMNVYSFVSESLVFNKIRVQNVDNCHNEVLASEIDVTIGHGQLSFMESFISVAFKRRSRFVKP